MPKRYRQLRVKDLPKVPASPLMQGTELTTEPPHPTNMNSKYYEIFAPLIDTKPAMTAELFGLVLDSWQRKLVSFCTRTRAINCALAIVTIQCLAAGCT